MKKNNLLYYIILFVLTVLPQGPVKAEENVKFDNPAKDFLIDLTKFSKPNTFAGLLTYLIELVLGVVGLLAIAFIIYGGFQYITSRGDEEQATSGKRTLTNAIIGLVIVILSYVIVTVIANALIGKVR